MSKKESNPSVPKGAIKPPPPPAPPPKRVIDENVCFKIGLGKGITKS